MTLACLATGAASITHAADPPRGAATPVPSDPVFRVLLIDGENLAGRVVTLGGEDETLAIAGERNRSVPLASVVSFTREGDPPPSDPEGSGIVFPDGDRLRAILGAAADTSLEVQPGALGDVATSIPLDSILGLVFAPPADPRAQADLLRRLHAEKRTSDLLFLANGDRLSGSFLGLTADRLEFQPETGKIGLNRSSVVALAFDENAVRYPRPEGLYLETTFIDGSRLGIAGARLEGGHLVGKARFGAPVRAALSAVWSVHVRSKAYAYLSERSEVAAQYVGYLGPHPGAFGRDRTWDGHPLRLGGQPYDHGIGMLPRTLAAYKLEPNDRRFQALIGLDDRAGERGNVVFRVLVDGKERFTSPPTTRRDAPRPVDVDVSGAKSLILSAEFGEGGDVQDSADWAEARLIRR